MRRTLAIVACTSLLALGACDSKKQPASGPGGTGRTGAGEQASPDVRTYTVRGFLRELPTTDGRLVIEHEAIDDFVGQDGAIAGMAAMEMPFPVADSVGFEGLSPDDPVEFRFEVWFDPTTDYQVVSIERLDERPSDLKMRPAAPPGSPLRTEIDARGEPTEIYAVRGIVREVPQDTDARPQLVLMHEAIPAFVGIDGKVVGMDAMTMPFPLATGATIDAVPGDSVQLWFAVWRPEVGSGESMQYRAFRAIPLDSGTPLDLPGA